MELKQTEQVLDASKPGDKWVRAILDLVKLTNQGKLTWVPTFSKNEALVYAADLDGTLLILNEMPSTQPVFTVSSGLLGLLGEAMSHYQRLLLSARTSNNIVTSFPQIEPLDALWNAVRAQNRATEDEVLSAIHKKAAS